jgi:hypothetical protein
MTDQLKETPSMLLAKTFEPKIREICKELGVKEYDFLEDGAQFKHNGYTCEIKFNAKK